MADKLRPLVKHRRATDFVTTRNGLCGISDGAMADQRDYAVRAIHADEQAERAVSPGLADRWRAVAKSYRTLARLGTTEMKYRRQPLRVPKIEDRYT